MLKSQIGMLLKVCSNISIFIDRLKNAIFQLWEQGHDQHVVLGLPKANNRMLSDHNCASKKTTDLRDQTVALRISYRLASQAFVDENQWGGTTVLKPSQSLFGKINEYSGTP